MAKINAYLNFDGNCEDAFNFYKDIFGGEFDYLGRFSEMPPQEGFELPEIYKNKIMHVSLPISKETILYGSDSCSEFPVTFGNNVSISITPDSREETEKLFNALAENGKITMPLEDTFWGAYFGMCIDKFGINWMVNFENNQEN